MASKIAGTIKSIPDVLISPEKAFKKDDYVKSSAFLIILIIYVLTLATALMSTAVMNRPELREFQVALSVKQAEKNMIGASEEDKQMMEEQVRAGMDSPVARIAQYVSIVISSAFWLVVPLLFWGLQVVAARFFGGEESPVTVQKKKGPKTLRHRKSLMLALYAHLPIALYSLIAGFFIFFRDAEAMTNVLTMEDLMAKMEVNLSLTGLLLSADLPIFLDTLLNTLTSPFYWWFFFITAVGMMEIWRLKKSGIITILGIWVVLMAAYAWGSWSLAHMVTA